MKLAKFHYWPELAQNIAENWLERFEPGPDTAPLEAAAQLMAGYRNMPGFAPGITLYHSLMSCRPNFFPPVSLTLLAGNLIAENANISPSCALLSWKMLPVLLLLTSVLPERATVYLPDQAAPYAPTIKDLLERYCFRQSFSWSKPMAAPISPVSQKLKHGLLIGEMDSSFQALFLTNWSFLGGTAYSQARRELIESEGVNTVIQLPKISGWDAYPGFVIFELPVKETSARMVDATFLNKDGEMDQEKALEVMVNSPSGNCSSEVTFDDIKRTDSYSLLPAKYLTKKSDHSASVATLGEIVQVIRCQLTRQPESEWIAQHGEDIDDYRSNDWDVRPVILHEASLTDMDVKTGFVNIIAGERVVAEIAPAGNSGKFLLQKNDILFLFKGTANSIAQTGFIAEVSVSAIPVRTACIVRVTGIDPVWLFYYLRQDSVRQRLQSLAVGQTRLIIGMKDLRSLPIELPAAWEVEKVRAQHEKIVNAVNIINKMRDRLEKAKKEISSLSIWKDEHSNLKSS